MALAAAGLEGSASLAGVVERLEAADLGSRNAVADLARRVVGEGERSAVEIADLKDGLELAKARIAGLDLVETRLELMEEKLGDDVASLTEIFGEKVQGLDAKLDRNQTVSVHPLSVYCSPQSSVVTTPARGKRGRRECNFGEVLFDRSTLSIRCEQHVQPQSSSWQAAPFSTVFRLEPSCGLQNARHSMNRLIPRGCGNPLRRFSLNTQGLLAEASPPCPMGILCMNSVCRVLLVRNNKLLSTHPVHRLRPLVILSNNKYKLSITTTDAGHSPNCMSQTCTHARAEQRGLTYPCPYKQRASCTEVRPRSSFLAVAPCKFPHCSSCLSPFQSCTPFRLKTPAGDGGGPSPE